MSEEVSFGWRIPGFPVDGSSGKELKEHIFNMIDTVQGDFSTAWFADHLLPWLPTQDPKLDAFECLTMLSFLAGKYTNMSFGSLVLSNPLRNPAMVAKIAATFQTISNGRFILGIGSGWKEDEYIMYGFGEKYPSIAVRTHQFNEAIQVIKLLWTEELTTFHGVYYHFEDVICNPKPYPIPPVLIGGGGKRLTLKLVAKYADMWNIPNGTPGLYSELMDILKGYCAEIGREFNSIIKTWDTRCVALSHNKSIALRIAEASPFYIPGEAIVGTPDDVTNQLFRYWELGVRHFILRFADFPKTDGAKLFVKEVIPRFRDIQQGA